MSRKVRITRHISLHALRTCCDTVAEKVLRSLSTVETLPVTVSLAGTFVGRSGAVVNTRRGSNCQFAQFDFERDAQEKHNTLQIYMCKNKQAVKKTSVG